MKHISDPTKKEKAGNGVSLWWPRAAFDIRYFDIRYTDFCPPCCFVMGKICPQGLLVYDSFRPRCYNFQVLLFSFVLI